MESMESTRLNNIKKLKNSVQLLSKKLQQQENTQANASKLFLTTGNKLMTCKGKNKSIINNMKLSPNKEIHDRNNYYFYRFDKE